MTNSEVRFGTNQSEFIPSNIDIEEAVLGVVLFSPQAITRICDRLPPEAFLLDCHRIIYQACIALNKKGKTCDTMSVHEYLKTSGKLNAIGGRLKLAQLVSSTVGNGPLEEYAELLVSKHVRRQIIHLGQEITELGYESRNDCPDILSHIEEKVALITKSPLSKDKDEFMKHQYNVLIDKVREIELRSRDPGFRLFKMQNLAREVKKSTRELEDIYYKSLVASENGQVADWELVNALFGKDSREWLMNGFLPKGKVILLHAKGGVGKTRLAYEFAYRLGMGESWSGFPVNGKYKVLIVQTDESPNDMLRVLHDRGFGPHVDVHYKNSWTVDHLEGLLDDMREWEPDFVLIDSLSSVSRNSTYSENDVEYARPILKLKDMAQETGASIMLIHHSSSQGTSRGSTAIFNSVSEVWKLDHDLSQSTDGLERLLKIEKTRSRAPATYRLRFNPEDKSWDCIGKELDDQNISFLTIKEKIVDFLSRNRGTIFEVEEIRNSIGGVADSVRRSAYQLAEDGVIYRKDSLGIKGSPMKYYLPEYGSNHSLPSNRPKNSDHLPDLPGFSDPPREGRSHPAIPPCDHNIIQQPQGLDYFPDHDQENTPENFSKIPKKVLENEGSGSENIKNVDIQRLSGDKFSDHSFRSIPDHPENNDNDQKNSRSLEIDVIDDQKDPEPAPHKPNYAITVDSLLGEWKVTLSQDRVFKDGSGSRVILEFFSPSGDRRKKTKVKVANRHKAEEFARKEIPLLTEALATEVGITYKVIQIVDKEGEPDFIWVTGCQLIKIPSTPLNAWYEFRSPSGDLIRVAGRDEFQLEN
ncbi:AAA family ATPase [Patescibacteria group bacterium]|nr:AAA family ATPase [Patescibacteria group bacterium]